MDIVVPDMANNVPEAVLLAHDPSLQAAKARVFLKAGQHTWVGYNFGRIEVLRPLHVVAQAAASLRGKFLLLEGSSGSFKHVRLTSVSPSTPEMRVHLDPGVYVRGSKPWAFDNCDFRSAGSIAVLVSRGADCTLQHCSLGGAAARTYEDEYDQKNCASEALQALGEAWVSLRFCHIQDTYGPGCSFLGTTHVFLESCLFTHNAIGMGFDRETTVTMKGCTIQDTFEAALWAMPGRSAMTAELEANLVYGRVWCSYKRPDKLTLRRNNFNETFPEQWNELLQTHPPMAHERVACGLTWMQEPPKDWVVPMAQGFPY